MANIDEQEKKRFAESLSNLATFGRNPNDDGAWNKARIAFGELRETSGRLLADKPREYASLALCLSELDGLTGSLRSSPEDDDVILRFKVSLSDVEYRAKSLFDVTIRKFAKDSVDLLDKKYYSAYRGSSQVLDEMLRAYFQPDYKVLDAGCGKYRSPATGKCRDLTGVDLDKDVFKNPEIDVPLVGSVENIPLGDGTFDAIVASGLVQHLEDPMACFREFFRVLKNEGLCVIYTPNVLNYSVLVTKMTPNWFQNWYMKNVVICVIKQDRLFYRANTPHRLVAMMRASGFEILALRLVENKPEYLRFSPITYRAGIMFERLLNRLDFLAQLRSSMIVVCKKRNISEAYE